MGFISRQIEDRYRKVLFSRHDPDERVYYFSAGDTETPTTKRFARPLLTVVTGDIATIIHRNVHVY